MWFQNISIYVTIKQQWLRFLFFFFLIIKIIIPNYDFILNLTSNLYIYTYEIMLFYLKYFCLFFKMSLI